MRRHIQALTTPMEVLSDDGRRAHCCPPAGGSHAYSARGRYLSHPPGVTVAKCAFAYLVHQVSQEEPRKPAATQRTHDREGEVGR